VALKIVIDSGIVISTLTFGISAVPTTVTAGKLKRVCTGKVALSASMATLASEGLRIDT
jgi:hypothetical protein